MQYTATNAVPSHDLLQNELIELLGSAWSARMGGRPEVVAFAPGRVNLLGAHLDYNEGFVLPLAVDRGTFVMARPRADRLVRLASLDVEPSCTVSLDDLAFNSAHGWANYVKGALAPVASELPGLDLFYGGNLPIGAGLSSSASILVATATAADVFLTKKRSRAEIVHWCRAAELEFVGVKCGIMDPYASVFGRLDYLLYLDCRTNTHVDVRFDSSRAAIIVCDTTVRRALADGRFNDRVRECGEAVAAFQQFGVPASALRDVSIRDLDRFAPAMDPLLARRARHVITEIERTRLGVDSLRRGDFHTFGNCLRESHRSCRDAYEVSSPELDALVDAAHCTEGTFGARLTGAGFGGCCVAVVDRAAVGNFSSEVRRIYEKETGLTPRLHVFRPSEGAHVVSCEGSV